MFYIGLVIGMILGGSAGFLLCALFVIAADERRKEKKYSSCYICNDPECERM